MKQLKRCGRCDQLGHHKGNCTTVLTVNEESAIARNRTRAANARNYKSRRVSQLSAAAVWKRSNPEKVKASYRALWKRHGERITKERKEARRVAYVEAPKETWLKETFRHARRRSKRCGLPHDQEIPDLELPDYCPVLGMRLNYGGFRGKAKSDSPSLDRIIPALGYVEGNLRVISYRANTLKNNATFDELRHIYLDAVRLVQKGNVDMIKRDEIEHTESCFNKAGDGERLFVLLARDPAAPGAIRAWVAERIRLGKNTLGDDQIHEALECAGLMDVERAEIESARRQQQMHWAEGGVAP